MGRSSEEISGGTYTSCPAFWERETGSGAKGEGGRRGTEQWPDLALFPLRAAAVAQQVEEVDVDDGVEEALQRRDEAVAYLEECVRGVASLQETEEGEGGDRKRRRKKKPCQTVTWRYGANRDDPADPLDGAVDDAEAMDEAEQDGIQDDAPHVVLGSLVGALADAAAADEADQDDDESGNVPLRGEAEGGGGGGEEGGGSEASSCR